MKRPLLLCLFVAFFSLSVHAQINAGDVPGGFSINVPGINLFSIAYGSDSSTAFDLDNDGVADIAAYLERGNIPVDGPNLAQFHLLNPNLSLCVDSTIPAGANVVRLYSFGDPMVCDSTFEWSNDSIHYLGAAGPMFPSPSSTLTNSFIPYLLSGNIGWINFSFDLTNMGWADSIFFNVHQVLVRTPTSVRNRTVSDLSIYPNPSNQDFWIIESDTPIISYSLYNMLGQQINHQTAPIKSICTPDQNGSYILELEFAEDQIRRSIVIKQ